MSTFDQALDVRGLNSPLPIIRTKKTLSAMTGGQILKIMATDPGSIKDYETFARHTGNELLSHSEVENEFHFTLKKSA